jgi:hypothetical protein
MFQIWSLEFFPFDEESLRVPTNKWLAYQTAYLAPCGKEEGLCS